MRTSLVAFAALAGGAVPTWAGHGPSSSLHASHRRHFPKRSSGYSLVTHATGQDFLDLFDFATGTGDNGGIAEYVDSSTAWSSDLVSVSTNGTVQLGVSTTQNSGSTRQAIKLTSKQTYQDGLYVWDVQKMPQVCGAWPAIWSSGADWPNQGEIDVVEYVSRQSMNSFSVHTGSGCTAGSSGYSGVEMLATAQGLDCDADATESQGCGFRTTRNDTAGPGANSNGGGVYALEWSSAGLKAWFFARDDVPSDVTSKNPDPSGWTTPDMFISASSCDPSTYFGPQTFIINTQLCGTWPNGVWSTDNSYAGQEGSCAEYTGASSCEDYVQSNGQDFADANWIINSFSQYSQGPGANNDGGGIYAVEWDNEVGIKSWFFPRSLIPSDIRSRTPNPASWGGPIMYIATEDCPTATYFAPQNVILDLNLCGTWGSATWNQSMRYAGVSEGSCAARTGFETCEQFVLEHGEALLEAFFKLRSFAYYRTDRALEPSWSEAVELDSGPMM
ncbi:hypothetical protein JCM5296_004978 [Sporobolomyces johnsonii]